MQAQLPSPQLLEPRRGFASWGRRRGRRAQRAQGEEEKGESEYDKLALDYRETQGEGMPGEGMANIYTCTFHRVLTLAPLLHQTQLEYEQEAHAHTRARAPAFASLPAAIPAAALPTSASQPGYYEEK